MRAEDPGDDHLVRTVAFRLLHHRVRLAPQRAEIGVEADNRQVGLIKQRVPVQISALAGGHARSAGHQTHHQGRRVDHKTVQLKAVVSGGPDSFQCFPGL